MSEGRTPTNPSRPALSFAPEPTGAVVWVLTAGPCAGEYVAVSTWPPPQTIRAVHGGGLLGDGPPAVLDLPDDEPEPGETLVEYRLTSHGFVCSRSRKASPPLTGFYLPAGMTDGEAKRALLIAAGIRPDLSVA